MKGKGKEGEWREKRRNKQHLKGEGIEKSRHVRDEEKREKRAKKEREKCEE